MRKIVSGKEAERKRKRNQILAGVVMMAVMFLSVIGYSLIGKEDESQEKITYNNIVFAKENNLWNANVGDFKFSFKYNPKEVEETSSEINLLDSYYGKPLYFSAGGAEAEIARNLFYQNQIVQRVQYACLEGEECLMDYPVKTCDDNIIIIKESDSTEIQQENNCLFIRGKKEDLVKLTDSALFKMIGIQ